MTQYVTLDVVDRPAGGALAALRSFKRLAASPPAGCLAAVPCNTGRFNPRPWPSLTPRRVALVAAWTDAAAAAGSPAGALAAGAREHWHVEGPLARSSGEDPWRTWVPDASGADPVGDEDPLLVLISGELRARYVPRFIADGAGAVAHAETHPGYLGGLGLASSPLNTTSCSAWRTSADARDYAFRPGRHADAMRTDRANGHHRTERFLRIRPLLSRGTLDGRDPFAGLLPARSAVAAV